MFSALRERGLSIIPVHKSKKNPVLNEWQKFCERIVSEAEAAEWDEKFKGYNVGVTLGPASNLMCVDIDTNNPAILLACPPSPVRRFGNKGEGRFFQFNPEIENMKIGEIDILSKGRQVLIPPSIHPITNKPYKWLTHETLETISAKDLPLLTRDDIQKMQALYGVAANSGPISLSGIFSSSDREYPHGSQDRMKVLASALINESSPIDIAVARLLEFDREHHKPLGYFSAFGKHGDAKTKDPYTNALVFYSNLMKSINSKRDVPIAPSEKATPEIKLTFLEAPKTFLKPYPKARGLMGDFQKLCEMSSIGDQDGLGLGGAHALMGILLSNKYKSSVGPHVITPNIYVLNLGFSSFGKELAQRKIVELLSNSKLVGVASYKSGTSITKNLPNQQERIDIVDEAAAFLGSMNGKESWKSEIPKILSSLFSKADSEYLGHMDAQDTQPKGACFNPHVNILASTNPAGFQESINRGLQAQGLMPRFLTFIQELKSDYRRITSEDLVKIKAHQAALQKKVDGFLAIPKIVHRPERPNLLENRGYQYKARLIPFSKEAEEAYFQMDEHYDKQKRKNPDSVESGFLGRLAELTAKSALHDAAGLGKDVIDLDSFEWARIDIETQFENSRSFYKLASADSVRESFVFKILDLIKSQPNIKHGDIGAKFQGIDKKLRQDILDDLEASQQIEKQLIEAGKTKQKTYVYRALEVG